MRSSVSEVPETETDEDGALGEMNQTIPCLDSKACSLLQLQLRLWDIHTDASVACNTVHTVISRHIHFLFETTQCVISLLVGMFWYFYCVCYIVFVEDLVYNNFIKNECN